MTEKEKVKLALEFLCQRFPACFFTRPEKRRPLTSDIHYDIDAKFEASIERDFIHKAIRAYRNNFHYQRSLFIGANRIDLDGNIVGEVTEREAAAAREAIVRLNNSPRIQAERELGKARREEKARKLLEERQKATAAKKQRERNFIMRQKIEPF